MSVPENSQDHRPRGVVGMSQGQDPGFNTMFGCDLGGVAGHLQNGGAGTVGMDFKVGKCDSAGPACSQGFHGRLLRSEAGSVVEGGVLALFAGSPFGRCENPVPKLFPSLFKGGSEPIHIDEVDTEPRRDVF